MNLCPKDFEGNTRFSVDHLVVIEGVEEDGVELLLRWMLVLPTPISLTLSTIDKTSQFSVPQALVDCQRVGVPKAIKLG